MRTLLAAFFISLYRKKQLYVPDVDSFFLIVMIMLRQLWLNHGSHGSPRLSKKADHTRPFRCSKVNRDENGPFTLC
jgi:hypothetical protein